MKSFGAFRYCVALIGILLGTASMGQTAASPAQQAFDDYTERLAADWMRANPAAATAQQYFQGAEQDALDRKLTATDGQSNIPLGAEQRKAFVARARAGLAGLKKFPLAALTPQQRVSAAALRWQLADALRMEKFSDQRFVFDQFRGLQVSLVNFLTQTHPLRTARDVENYLVRLQQVAAVLDEGIAVARAREAKGTVPPGFILRATVGGIDRFLGVTAADNVLVTSLATRSQSAQGLSGEARSQAVSSARDIVLRDIDPAFGRVRALLAAEMPRATEDAGLWRLAQGGAAYAAALRSNTTTELDARKIYAVGLAEVARIEAQMDAELRALGLGEGSVGERFDTLENSLQPAPEPDPRAALLQRHRDILSDAEQRAASLFDLRPRAPVQVLREPAFTEQNAAAHYSSPAPDGSRPGTVWIPLPGPKFGILTMRTLTYHEGVPGHHFQIGLQQESTDIPLFRRKRVFGGLPAFSEGWGLYAEQLAAESGWYDGDPQGHLGQLHDELFRAKRLVVDTGLHAERWTRQQAIDYGIPPAEVERYVVMPGQACAYKMGELEILKLRGMAQQALGPAFSLRKFHDLLLRTGTVPLAVLKTVVDADIAATRGH
jgi:uncharacterized protein (DUF885 family)